MRSNCFASLILQLLFKLTQVPLLLFSSAFRVRGNSSDSWSRRQLMECDFLHSPRLMPPGHIFECSYVLALTIQT